jgi:hypothetical protein
MTHNTTRLGLLALGAALFIAGCESETPTEKPASGKPAQIVATPDFNADSAYRYIADQVEFGPRVPGTDAHRACGDYLIAQLERFGADVIVQESTVTAWDGTKLPMRNIIGQYRPDKRKRIMLYAHWDTRPYADKDSTRTKEPIDGANDGGSGVGVLLEVARQLGKTPAEVGVDIVLFDVEDYGPPEWADTGEEGYRFWCLGSQYWAYNKHRSDYRAKYGILLDMVGSKKAIFNKEGTSMALAPNIVNHVWGIAQELGYEERFRDKITPQTVDDNYFVNYIAGIPSANIVEYHIDVLPMGYGLFHHTHLDNMSIIDTATVGMVGHVVLEAVYRE